MDEASLWLSIPRGYGGGRVLAIFHIPDIYVLFFPPSFATVGLCFKLMLGSCCQVKNHSFVNER
jgi:hypothetical protein